MTKIKRNKKYDLQNVMRVLHRDLGYLTIGLTLVYALSGILLIYRNTDFLKVEKTQQVQLHPELRADELNQHVRIRNFKVDREDGEFIYFKEGYYNISTGKAQITRKVYPTPINKLVDLHKVTGDSKMSIVALIYGIIFTFFAISAMFMFKFGSKKNKRGWLLMLGSTVITIAILMLM